MVTAMLKAYLFSFFCRQQETFAVEGGDAARACGRDGLTVVGILDVTRGEDSFECRLRCSRLGYDVAFGVESELAGEDLGVGVVAYGEEESRDVDYGLLTRGVAQTRTRHALLVAKHLDGVVLEHHLDVGRLEYTLLHGLRCAQEGFAHDHVDLTAERCQICGLLARRVAAAHDGYILLAVEESVACGAGADAAAAVARLRLQPEITCRGSRGDDDAFGLDLLLAVDGGRIGALVKVYGRDDTRTHVGAETLCLKFHLVHQVGTRYSLGEAREVLDLGCGCELAARLDTLIKYGADICACGIYCGRISCGAAAYDKTFYVFGFHGISILCFRFNFLQL